MSYKYYKYPVDVRIRSIKETMDHLDWLWRNIGCSKTGNYERHYMLSWKLDYYTDEDMHIEAHGLGTIHVPVDNWTTRDCNFGKVRFYFKNAEDAMAFKLRWL